MDKPLLLTKMYNGRNVTDDNSKFIFDRFGILSSVPNLGYDFKIYSKPKKCKESLIELSKKRAKSLGSINLAWNDGVDSTFILAVYKDLGLDVKPYLIARDYTKPVKNIPLFNYVNENFDLHIIDREPDSLSLYTGATSDILFDSVARRNGGKTIIKNCVILKDLPNPPYNKDLYPWLNEYAKELGVELLTENDVLRLVVLCFKYYFYCYANGIPSILGINQHSFFDTQEFTDYAFTNCWHRQGLLESDPTYKKIQKDYIKEVFGKDFGVRKTV